MIGLLLLISGDEYHPKIEELFNTYNGDMLRFARSEFSNLAISNHESYAEDAVQNAFIKIVKYIDRIDFSASKKSIKTYLFSILSNEISDMLSKLKFHEEIYDKTVSDDERFIEEIYDRVSYEELIAKIRGMDEKYSTVLMYYYCNDLKVKKIAKMLGISEKAVYTRLERGKAILIKALNSEVSYGCC